MLLMLQDIYSSLAEDPEFFPEEQIYWEPGSDTTDIYKQLSNKKYREIIRHQIKLVSVYNNNYVNLPYVD